MNNMKSILKSDLIEIFGVVKLISKEIYSAYLIENTIWIHNYEGKVIGYISYNHDLDLFMISINHGNVSIKKEFKTRNELLIYLKKDFISELTAGLI